MEVLMKAMLYAPKMTRVAAAAAVAAAAVMVVLEA